MRIVSTLKPDEKITDPYVLKHKKDMITGEFLADYYNEEFQVYGIHVLAGVPYYYICFDEYSTYPTPVCGLFCRVIDHRLSSYWQVNLYKGFPNKLDITTQLIFDEWAQSDSFYEDLIDGDPKAKAIFAKYRKLMDEEFA